jgi:Ca2+-binding EF-hand superfamily protein
VPQPRFDPKDYIDSNTTEKDVVLYKEVFDFLDSNNNGALQPMDIRKAFSCLGHYRPPKKH